MSEFLFNRDIRKHSFLFNRDIRERRVVAVGPPVIFFFLFYFLSQMVGKIRWHERGWLN